MPERPMPSVMWVALITLALVGAVQLIMGLGTAHAPMIVSGMFAGILVWALRRGARWAYVFTLLIIVLTVGLAIASGAMQQAMALVVFNAFVWVPLLIASDWFWRHRGVATA